MPKQKKYTECVICRKSVATRSRYCNAHKHRANRYGDPKAKPLPVERFDVELQLARRYLQLHSETTQVAAALKLADAVLGYRAETRITFDLRLQDALDYQRSAGATPAEVAARVVAFRLYTNLRAFKSQCVEFIALGRLILHIAPYGGMQWSGHTYHAAGELAAQYLGPFATWLDAKVQRDAKGLRDLVAQSAGGSP